MDSDLLLAGRPSEAVPAGLAERVRARWAEERAEAAAYRRWTVGLATAVLVLGAAAAVDLDGVGFDALADPFEAPAAYFVDDVFPAETAP